MIHFVTTRSHAYTVRHVVAMHGRHRCRRWNYESLFRRRSIPSGTWIFTDHERLSAFELTLASQIATQLENGGARVLNHPARVRCRYEFLRAANEAGINRFAVHRCESFPRPRSFPVFIRREYDHDVEGTELIASQEDLDAALQAITGRGNPLAGNLVIEYAGEEAAPGIWRRLSTYRVGTRIIAHHQAVAATWLVKEGLDGAQLRDHPQAKEFIEAEREFVLRNHHAEALQKAFALAGIDYGRADFAIVQGRPQIYEINTNPNHALHASLYQSIHPDRESTQRHSEDALQSAILDEDSPARGRIALVGDALSRQRKFWNRWSGTLWRP